MAGNELLFREFEGVPIWVHYKRSSCGNLAECKICKRNLKCHGGSTKGLHVHLKSSHNIELLKRNILESDINKTQNKIIIEKQKKLNCFMEDESLPAVLARMIACDGLSFKIFITSKDLRKSLTALGHSVPRSSTSIKELVMQYGQQLRHKIIQNIVNRRSEGENLPLHWMNGHL